MDEQEIVKSIVTVTRTKNGILLRPNGSDVGVWLNVEGMLWLSHYLEEELKKILP